MSDPHEDKRESLREVRQYQKDWQELGVRGRIDKYFHSQISPEEIEEMDRLIESCSEYQEMLERVVREAFEEGEEGEGDRLSSAEDIRNWLRNL